MPRTILPNVYFEPTDITMLMLVLGGFIMGCGFMIFSYEAYTLKFFYTTKKELKVLKERFAVMSREYTEEIVKLKGKKK